MSAATIERAHAVHPISAVQSEYSPMVRNPEVAVLETCRRLGIGFVAFSPVARGLLAGAIRSGNYAPGDIRAAMPRFVEPNLSHNLKAVARFDALASQSGCTPAQLALGWLLSRGEHVIPIPGTQNLAHLEENIVAASLHLDEDVLGEIERTFGGDAIRGARYSAAMQAQIDTELLPDEELAA
jgi:aryl-alcohol dehydrogenase-like predicted oxidoreductase